MNDPVTVRVGQNVEELVDDADGDLPRKAPARACPKRFEGRSVEELLHETKSAAAPPRKRQVASYVTDLARSRDSKVT